MEHYPLPEKDYMVMIRCFTYNHEAYIEDALKGFVMQKTNFPFVAVVVDDASTDGTAEIIRRYEAEYPDIIKGIYLKENHYSQKKKKAPYVKPWRDRCTYEAVCEGDDYWIDPLKLQKQVEFMEKNPDYSMCCHNAIVLNQVSTKRERIKSFNYFTQNKEITISEIINDWYIPTASILYRISARKVTPSFFSGDYILSLMLASAGKIYYLNEFMSVYRLNRGGVSVNVNAKKWSEQMCKLLNWYNEYTQGKHDPIIQARIKDVKLFEKYCILRKKGILIPFILMPLYTMERIKVKLQSIY